MAKGSRVPRFKGSKVQGSRFKGSKVQGSRVQRFKVQGFKVQGKRYCAGKRLLVTKHPGVKGAL
jgi:hypothetical protein